ncbi:toprim domain-containing protein [bacterium]|nr:toprim domain-containing protein [bacterium]
MLRRLDDEVKELIFATNPTPEGEATASYIWSKLKDKTVVCSRLASGVPMGASLEFMDRVTIGKALQGRRPF